MEPRDLSKHLRIDDAGLEVDAPEGPALHLPWERLARVVWLGDRYWLEHGWHYDEDTQCLLVTPAILRDARDLEEIAEHLRGTGEGIAAPPGADAPDDGVIEAPAWFEWEGRADPMRRLRAYLWTLWIALGVAALGGIAAALALFVGLAALLVLAQATKPDPDRPRVVVTPEGLCEIPAAAALPQQDIAAVVAAPVGDPLIATTEFVSSQAVSEGQPWHGRYEAGVLVLSTRWRHTPAALALLARGRGVEVPSRPQDWPQPWQRLIDEHRGRVRRAMGFQAAAVLVAGAWGALTILGALAPAMGTPWANPIYALSPVIVPVPLMMLVLAVLGVGVGLFGRLLLRQAGAHLSQPGAEWGDAVGG